MRESLVGQQWVKWGVLLTVVSVVSWGCSSQTNAPLAVTDAEIDAAVLDSDEDGVFDPDDVCPETADPDQLDSDGDGRGDACDLDDDDDGLADVIDSCPLIPNADDMDLDNDGFGNQCDDDDDGDGVPDVDDVCPLAVDDEGVDLDGDGLGDVCDSDIDGDGVPNEADNCAVVANPEQIDTDRDLLGDACDDDIDGDDQVDTEDNCPDIANRDQSDRDGDLVGDVCDPCPDDAEDDVDGDSVCADVDNCPVINNPRQDNVDGDAFGDVCDPCPLDEGNDADGDGACADVDNCPIRPNDSQADRDDDGLGDICDACPNDPANDADGDGHCGDRDRCPDVEDPLQLDSDLDGVGDACDACPLDADNDLDGDTICGDVDNCPETGNDDQADADGDGYGDACDFCEGGGPEDPDEDGICFDEDNCPNLANPDQTNSDGDLDGDLCDPCPFDPENDVDGDRICGDTDVCVGVPDPDQLDLDGDGIGDACDDDVDGDLTPNDEDNCPEIANEDQAQTYGDARGDACERRYLDEDFEAPLEDWTFEGRWRRDASAAAQGQFGLASPIRPVSQTIQAESMRATTGANFEGFWAFTENGQVHTDAVRIPSTGTYELSAVAYGVASGGESPRMELRVDGRPRAEFIVDATVAEPATYTQRVRLTAGRHAVSFVFINAGGEEAAPRQLYLDALTVTGPDGSDRGLLAGGPSSAESPVLNFRNAQRPRLSFSTRFLLPDVVLVYEALARGEVLASGRIGRGALDDGFHRFSLDLTALAGEPRVRIRFGLIVSPNQIGGVDIDDVVVDERNPLPALPLPYRFGFESFDGWFPSGARWTISDRAYLGGGAAELLVAPPGFEGDSILDLAQPLDLSGTEAPILSMFISGGPYDFGNALVAEVIPSGRRNHFVSVQPIRQSGSEMLYRKIEIPLGAFAGDPALGLRLRYRGQPGDRPFTLRIDELMVAEADALDPAVLPVDSGFPYAGVSFDSAGWGIVENADGESVLRSGEGIYGDDTRALVSLGHFDFGDVRSPRASFWARYALRSGEQSVTVVARSDTSETRHPLVDPGTFNTPQPLAVTNPSAEQGLDGWTVEEGTIEALSTGECGAYSPHDGQRYFALGGRCEPSAVGRLTQTLDLGGQAASISEGLAVLRYRARARTAEGQDTVSMTVTFLDADGAALGETLDAQTQSDIWTDLSVETPIPVDAAAVRIGMSGARALPGANHAGLDAVRVDVYLPESTATAAFYERLEVDLSAHAGAVTELFLESVTDERSGDGIEINRLEVYDWAARRGVVRRQLQNFENDPLPDALAGPWGLVDGVGRNGSTGLSPLPGTPLPGRVQRRRVEYMPAMNLSDLRRPRLSFWLRYDNAVAGHAFNVRVHASDRADTRDAAERVRHGRVFPIVTPADSMSAAQSQGFQRIELPLDGFAGSEATSIIFETVEWGDERVELVIDDVVLDDRPDHPDAAISLDAVGAYTVYLNGEEIGTGEGFGTAERFYAAIEPGRNVLAIEAEAGETPQTIIGSLRYGNLVVSTGDEGWLSSNDAPPGWTELAFEDAAWSPVSADGARAQDLFPGHWLLLDAEQGARPVGHVDGGERQYFRVAFEAEDWDRDGLPDPIDLCPNLESPDQSDWNGNGVGDVCDPCPTCFNVALGASVRAATSASGAEYLPARVTDGQHTCGSWVAQNNSGWVEVDLGTRHRVCGYRWSGSTRCGEGTAGAQDWDVTLSGGGGPAVTLQSADTDARTARTGPNAVALDECVVGRFFRFAVFQGYGAAGIGEIEVYGTPVPREPVCSVDGEFMSRDVGAPTNALWLVDTASSSINRWDTSGDSPVLLAQYRVGNPANVCQGRCCWDNGCNMPSRIAIDAIGDVYVASRGFNIIGSVTKIAGDLERCVDRNENGAIETSLDGAPLDYGADECVLWTTNVGESNDVLRALAVDHGDAEAPGGYVWVGSYNRRRAYKLHPDDGRELLRLGVPMSPYAMLTDATGTLWISGLHDGRLIPIDTVTHEVGAITRYPNHVRGGCNGSYASTIDIYGRIWQSGWTCRDAVAYDPATDSWCSMHLPEVTQLGRGITTDLDGRVYAAADIGSVSHVAYWHVDDCVAGTRTRIPPAQLLRAGEGQARGPTAVAFDGQGDVWLAQYSSPHLVRFNTSDGNTSTVFDAPGTVYSYSDVSGGIRQVVRSGLRGVEGADYCVENTCGEDSVVDYLGPEGGVVAVDTRDGAHYGEGSCGGGGGQAVVVVAVTEWSRLEARLHDEDFVGVVQIRAQCTDARTELACDQGNAARASVARVPPGTYFIIVDGEDGSMGRGNLRVDVQPL